MQNAYENFSQVSKSLVYDCLRIERNRLVAKKKDLTDQLPYTMGVSLLQELHNYMHKCQLRIDEIDKHLQAINAAKEIKKETYLI